VATIESGRSSDILAVDAYNKGARMAAMAPAPCYRLAGRSGLIAATTSGFLFLARLDPSAPNGTRAFITRIKLDWSTITAFTTPVTDRWLELVRGAGAAPSGGNAINPASLYTSDPNSEVSAGSGGIGLIANTGALTVTSITFETNIFAPYNLTGFGTAGATVNYLTEFPSMPIVLSPGEMLGLRTAAALDAAGTARLGVAIDYYEGIL
jgi:hypothetical protein